MKQSFNVLIISLAIIAASFLLGNAFKDAKRLDNISRITLKVKGYAEKDIESDFGKWTGQFGVRNSNLQAAYIELNIQREIVLQHLVDLGLQEDQIDFSTVFKNNIFRQKENGYGETNEIIAYYVYQNVSFESNDLELIESISKKSIDVIRKGVNFSSYNPDYYYTKLDDLKLEMLKKATSNAKERADILAESSGNSVDALISASQGVFQIVQRNSTNVSDYGIYDTKSREKTIKLVVTAEYSIK